MTTAQVRLITGEVIIAHREMIDSINLDTVHVLREFLATNVSENVELACLAVIDFAITRLTAESDYTPAKSTATVNAIELIHARVADIEAHQRDNQGSGDEDA